MRPTHNLQPLVLSAEPALDDGEQVRTPAPSGAALSVQSLCFAPKAARTVANTKPGDDHHVPLTRTIKHSEVNQIAAQDAVPSNKRKPADDHALLWLLLDE